MTLHPLRTALAGTLLAGALAASAQTATDLVQAQKRHDRQIAACNSGKLPAPEREACVRDAGAALDQARGGPPTTVTNRTRRATIVSPAGAPVPSDGTETVRSRRSTTVMPADQPTRQP